MLRLIHTADWQIGREYGQFAPDDAAALAAARLTTVSHIGERAASLGADAIVVAGDVFDAPTIADKTIRRLFAALESFDGPWILIPGNHDAALSAGVWERAEKLGCISPNVRVLVRPQVLTFESFNTSFLAAPLSQRHAFSDLTAAFDQMVSPDGHYRIGIAHGSVTGLLQEGAETGNPISPDRTSLAKLDYLALGDWHGMKQINPRMWYAGTPEQDRFRGNEPGHILEVELAHKGAEPVVRAHQIGQYRWHELQLALQGRTSVTELSHQLEPYGERDVLRLNLTGSVSLSERRALDELLGSLEARLRGIRCDLSELTLGASDEDIAGLQVDGYLALVLEELRGESAELSEPVRQEALRLLADAITQTGSTAGRQAG